MKRLKLLPIIISISLVHSSFATVITSDSSDLSGTTFDPNKYNFSLDVGIDEGNSLGGFGSGFDLGFVAPMTKSLAESGVSYAHLNFHSQLMDQGGYGTSFDEARRIDTVMQASEFGHESFDTGGAWYMSSVDSFECKQDYVPSAALSLANTFAQGTCQNTSNKKADYCGCIQGRVETLGLAKKYQNKDTKDMVAKNIDKMKKAHLFDLTNDAVFSYVAMSEKVGYGMLSSVDAHFEISQLQKESKAPLCIPGNLKAMIEDLKSDDGNPCFTDKDKKKMNGVFKRAFKERKKEFPNLRVDEMDIAKSDFDDLILETDLSLTRNFRTGLGRVTNWVDHEKITDNSVAELVENPSLIGNDILPNRSLAMQNAYVVGDTRHNNYGESVFTSVDNTNYMKNLAQIEEVYLKDPIMREQFYSFMYSYSRDQQLDEEIRKGFDFLNPNFEMQYFSNSDAYYDAGEYFKRETRAHAKKMALEGIAESMYRKALEERGGDEPLTSSDFSEQMSKIRNNAIVASANHCNKAFEKVKRACNKTAKEIVSESFNNPEKVSSVVNRLTNYEDSTLKKNQDDYIEKHIKAGAIACVEWAQFKRGGSKANSDEAGNVFDTLASTDMNDETFVDGEGVRVAVTDTFESNDSAIEEVDIAEAGGGGIIDASDSDYDRVTGFNNKSTASNFRNPLTSAIGNYSTSNFDNYRNVASVGSDTGSKGSTSSDEVASTDPQVDSLINGYNAKIAEMQKKLEDMNKKLEDAEKKKQADEMAKLNEAISKATSTINKLQSDKKKLVQQLANGNTPASDQQVVPSTANTAAATSIVDSIVEPKVSTGSSSSGSIKADGLSSNSSFTSRRNAAGVFVDANGMTSDDYLYQLREGSMQGQAGTVLTLSSLKDPSIGDQVKSAFKSGDRVIYANVNGAVYRIIPQVDSNGNILEKGGEVVYVTEVVGGEIDSELQEMQEGKVKGVVAKKDEEKKRAPASIPAGMTQQGNSDDVKFGYDAMMDLTEEALEK